MPTLAAIQTSAIFVELGIIVLGLAILARLANRLGFSAIPLYLVAGLAFGNGGILPLRFGQEAIHLGADLGVVLLLFMLGLEYTGEELWNNLRTGYPSGLIDIALNFVPGFVAGLLLGWGPMAGIVLGGVTYVSSSGIIAKVLGELKRMSSPETPSVVSLLVLEDLSMAVYLPIVGVLLAGKSAAEGAIAVFVALIAVGAVLFVAIRYGKKLTKLVSHQSDEVVLLSTLGLVLLVAGLAQKVQVSSAIGAFLVGVAVSGSLVERAHRLITPLRDLTAATFFLFFGLEIDPSSLGPVALIALALGVATTISKIATGWLAAKNHGVETQFRLRAGAAMVPRGEFSIVIAGLATTETNPQLQSLSAAYVLLLAIVGPILMRFAPVRPAKA